MQVVGAVPKLKFEDVILHICQRMTTDTVTSTMQEHLIRRIVASIRSAFLIDDGYRFNVFDSTYLYDEYIALGLDALRLLEYVKVRLWEQDSCFVIDSV